MSEHIIALSTYGSQHVKHPHTKQTISAYKMDYSSAASAVLLTLYGSQARDVSSKHASYHYIQIDSHVTIRHGHILLKVTDEELARAEAITRRFHRPAVYRWQEDVWMEFPSLNHAAYTEIAGRSGPNFNPTGMRMVLASTGEAESAIVGITVEMTQRSENDTPWHWIRGATYPHRETLKRWGCRWSRKRKSWYYTGAQLPKAIQTLINAVNTQQPETVSDEEGDPCCVEEATAILGISVIDQPPTPIVDTDVTQQSNNEELEQLPDEPEDVPKIRIIKPVLKVSDGDAPDVIVTAIHETKPEALPVIQSSPTNNGSRNLIRIPQAPCGELTGSISGNVWCYGWAIHEGICVYVNMGGPRMAVEAIRGKLSKGDIVSCVPWDAPSVELTAGEGNTGMYSAFMQNIPEAKFTSLILCHELLIQPNYGGKSTSFIIEVSDERAMAQLRQHITKLVKVPVFPEWTGYLWQAGQRAMLLRPTRTGGDIKLWTVELDADAWTRLITGGLAQGIITLPQMPVQSGL